MGFLKEDKSLNRVAFVVPRWIKTLFFLITMLISLLLFSAPILLAVADALPPLRLLPRPLPFLPQSADLSSPQQLRLSLLPHRYPPCLHHPLRHHIISCDGPRLSRGPYLAIATVCSAASLVFVSLKASYLLMISSYSSHSKGGYVRAMEAALFVSSLGLAIGHVVVAYRTSCRERRKLLVYKIDIEAFHPKEIGSLMSNEVEELHKP
ncbi:UNVERIFIED_CONTAM: hypothetical protein Scaly_2481300 [Sesamum calycinum]|uniref:MENTAL domain-containing protein n=1 Tax=Sesamum calycinum TaxID=2727403 RepID=A0AAW2LTK9_9LAMI